MINPTGWMLHPEDRAMLIARFAPLFPDVSADHVTLDGTAGPDSPMPIATSGQVVGEIDDGAGVQALVVAIDGTTTRPDGSTYHLTWSVDAAAGRHAIESNTVIGTLGWRAVEPPITVRLEPARLPAAWYTPAP